MGLLYFQNPQCRILKNSPHHIFHTNRTCTKNTFCKNNPGPNPQKPTTNRHFHLVCFYGSGRLLYFELQQGNVQSQWQITCLCPFIRKFPQLIAAWNDGIGFKLNLWMPTTFLGFIYTPGKKRTARAGTLKIMAFSEFGDHLNLGIFQGSYCSSGAKILSFFRGLWVLWQFFCLVWLCVWWGVVVLV